MGMGQNPWCTPEYFVWINEEDELAQPRRERLTELEDLAAALQIYHEILPHYLITITSAGSSGISQPYVATIGRRQPND